MRGTLFWESLGIGALKVDCLVLLELYSVVLPITLPCNMARITISLRLNLNQMKGF